MLRVRSHFRDVIEMTVLLELTFTVLMGCVHYIKLSLYSVLDYAVRVHPLRYALSRFQAFIDLTPLGVLVTIEHNQELFRTSLC